MGENMDTLKIYIKKHIYVVPIAIILLLFIIYLILCMMAGSNDFLSNTTINGLSVGSMSKEEAITALESQYEEDSENLALTYVIDDNEYVVDLTDNVTINISESVEEISDKVSNNFFMKGYRYLFGNDYYTPISIDDEVLLAAIEDTDILDYDTKVATIYEVGDNEVVFTKGTSGKKTDQEDLMEQAHVALNTYSFNDTITVDLVTSELDEDEMANIYEVLSSGGENATLKLDEDYNYEIVPETNGATYELETAQSEYKSAKEGSEFSVEATVIKADIDADTLEENLFREVIGEYTTYVSGSSTRRTNVKLAAEKCEVILLAGETFSFNDTVGERTTENGFGYAAAYLNGETVQEIGGGVCQASSTLYNAVVLANLEVVERSNHTYISSYVPLGRDATVSWGGPDFKFTNDTDYPIKIVTSYSGNYLTVQIYGTDLENTTVEFTYEKLATVARKVTYKDDATLEEGTEKIETSGSDGAKVQTYRKVYKDGELVSTTKESYSYYAAHEQVVLRGTKKVEEKTEETTESSESSDTSTDTSTDTTTSTDSSTSSSTDSSGTDTNTTSDSTTSE
ncbi:MAG: VanW family protein [Erysipelotrichaceae bacterium]|nr:VanW family protein [Erysipelotrichaceae bacterium]